MEDNIRIFSGSSHPDLTKEIAQCSHHLKMGQLKIETFPDGEIFVQVDESIRGKTAFVVQTLAHRPNHFLVELLIIIDALRRASAKNIVVVLPYYAYSRQDRKDKGRVPITARLVANLIERAGADRVLMMDLHADQIQGFFDIPTDNLLARTPLIENIRKLPLKDIVVGAPDVGSIKLAKTCADLMKTDFIIIDKRRLDPTHVDLSAIIGNVRDKTVLFVDDMISTASTLCNAARACLKSGAKEIYALATHGIFVGDSVDHITKSDIKKIFVTNTIPIPKGISPKIDVVSIASVFAEAIQCIISKQSISSLFNR